MASGIDDTQALRHILEVTRKLAAPFDLDTMLEEVVDASREVLNADRGTVFLYDGAAVPDGPDRACPSAHPCRTCRAFRKACALPFRLEPRRL